MNRNTQRAAALLGAIALSIPMAACGGGKSAPESGQSGSASGSGVELSMAGWALSQQKEFKTLADAFTKANPDIKVNLKEYSADDYDTQLTADLGAGSAPDIIPIKNLPKYGAYAESGKLLDITNLYDEFKKDSNISSSLDVFLDGDKKSFALPYRKDLVILFYNKDLFKKAGVTAPDGTWTWDDYTKAAKDITEKLKGTDTPALGTYIHTWPDFIQQFAQAQTPGADILSGDYSYMKKYYERAIDLQKSGATLPFATAQAQKVKYQAQFGGEKAAMTTMGSWYIQMLAADQKSGESKKFEWGIAPAPQYDKAATSTPVTYGGFTGISINAGVKAEKKEAAEKFLKFISGEEGAKVLAGIGISPAYTSDAVTAELFGLDGVPKDELSKKAYSGQKVFTNDPKWPHLNEIQKILGDAHTAIMTEDQTIDAGLKEASDQVASKGLVTKK